MKLNFWQWLGIALLVIGAILLFRNKTSTTDTRPPTTTQR